MSNKAGFWNIANEVSLSRLLILPILIYFLYINSFLLRLTALVLSIIVIAMDWVDGYLARRYKVATEFGAVLDVAIDRIVENIFWIVLAHLRIFPIWAPLIVITRGFLIDAVRSMALTKGKQTFDMMESKLGYALVASHLSRGLYGISKVLVFILGIMALTYNFPWLNSIIYITTIYVVAFCVVRGLFTIWDSRNILTD